MDQLEMIISITIKLVITAERLVIFQETVKTLAKLNAIIVVIWVTFQKTVINQKRCGAIIVNKRVISHVNAQIKK